MADGLQWYFELIDRVTFTGGEVLLLQKDILDLVAYATKLGKKTRIVSNGFWARNKASGRVLLAQLREAGLTELVAALTGWPSSVAFSKVKPT